MANKKAASTKKTTAKKPAAKASTTIRTLRADDKPSVASKAVKTDEKVNPARPVASDRKSQAIPGNIVNIVLAELFGTFALTLTFLFAAQQTSALYIGLVFAVLAIAVSAVSGAHFNPAITVAKWSMRQLKAIMLPFYLGAQFLGAMLAVIVINWLTGNALRLAFTGLGNMNWALFGIELIGTLVLMFAYAAATSRRTLDTWSSALGAGLAVMAGLVVASSLLANVQSAVDTSKITSIDKVPHELRVKSATLNPAVALASTEQTDNSFTSGSASRSEDQVSRLSLEVLLGSLLGAVIGGNLYLFIAGSRRDQ